MSLKVFEPAFGCFIIMCSCINDTVAVIFIWKITAVLTSIKSKLQYFHSRESTFFQHFQNTFCKESKILGDHAQLFDFFMQSAEQFHTRSLFPFTVFGSLIPIRDCIILIKSAKMVNTHNIIKFQTVAHSLNPPAIIVFFQFFPVIQRISPKLSDRRKCIRRTSRNRFRIIVFIKLEHLRICPCI